MWGPMWTLQGVAAQMSGFVARLHVLTQRLDPGSMGESMRTCGENNLEGEGLMQAA